MPDPWTRPRTLLEAVLADGLSAHREAIHEALRRIPELEAELERKSEAIQKLWKERDELRAQVERWSGHAAYIESHFLRLEAERDELRKKLLEEVGAFQSMREDAERLDWLTFNLPGRTLRAIGVVWGEHADARAAIDAARKQQ